MTYYEGFFPGCVSCAQRTFKYIFLHTFCITIMSIAEWYVFLWDIILYKGIIIKNVFLVIIQLRLFLILICGKIGCYSIFKEYTLRTSEGHAPGHSCFFKKKKKIWAAAANLDTCCIQWRYTLNGPICLKFENQSTGKFVSDIFCNTNIVQNIQSTFFYIMQGRDAAVL